MRNDTRHGLKSAILAVIGIGQTLTCTAQEVESPASAPATFVETDDEAGTTTVTLPATDGLIAWSDIIRAAAQLGRLDDSALSQLPDGSLNLNRANARLAISGLDLALPPEISIRIVGRDDAGQNALRLSLDRHRLRERNRGIKRTIREKLGTAERQFGLVLDEDWEQRVPERRIIVLIHGYNSTSHSLDGLRAELNRRGWPCAVFDYPNDGPIEESGRLLSEELRAFAAEHPDRSVTIVAHSMGGLVARVAIEDPQFDPGNVSQLIMIGTPNQGSQMAHFAGGLECCEHLVQHREQGFENMLRLSIADGLNEARADLKPGSEFLRELNARDRNPKARYSLLLGTQGPFSTEQLEEFRSVVSAAAERNRAAQLVGPRIAEPLADMDELLLGAGDGAVAVKRGRLEGVDDTVLLPFSHLALTRKLDRESTAVLRDAILSRIDQAQ